MNKKPNWIKATALSSTAESTPLKEILEGLAIHTVCREADCPNQGECWRDRTATFMLLGDQCTRNCRFCGVNTSDPRGSLDLGETTALKKAVKRLKLEYLVVTSVDRDDLADGGANHFSRTIEEVKSLSDPPLMEALVPDFSGKVSSLREVAESELDVLGHNLETVRRLTPKARDPRAGYELSLSVLETFKQLNEGLVTKSSLMVGLGETKRELLQALEDLRSVGVEIVTIGQYLRPGEDQLPVERFWKEEEFEDLKREANELGFSAVVAGPFVRSSFKAQDAYGMVKTIERK